MSCSITKVLDPKTNKIIDTGVDVMAAKISAAVKLDDVNNAECRASEIDRMVNIVNMVLQYIILSFVKWLMFSIFLMPLPHPCSPSS